MTRSAGLAAVLLLSGCRTSSGLIAERSYVCDSSKRSGYWTVFRARKTRTRTATMATMATTLDLAMRHITHITVKCLIMFWATPSHTTATWVGAAGDTVRKFDAAALA